MPTLRNLTCSIEHGPRNRPLEEWGTYYIDNVVDTYVAVPEADQTFTIHLKSIDYIADGLAMFVFIDAAYQCNRNRCRLVKPGPGVKGQQTLVDFKVRQREFKGDGGKLLGSDWSFRGLNRAAADQPSEDEQEFMGQIEVVVLRCKEKQENKTSDKSYKSARPAFVLGAGSMNATDDGRGFNESTRRSPDHKSEKSHMSGMFDGSSERKHGEKSDNLTAALSTVNITFHNASPHLFQFKGDRGKSKSGDFEGWPDQKNTSFRFSKDDVGSMNSVLAKGPSSQPISEKGVIRKWLEATDEKALPQLDGTSNQSTRASPAIVINQFLGPSERNFSGNPRLQSNPGWGNDESGGGGRDKNDSGGASWDNNDTQSDKKSNAAWTENDNSGWDNSIEDKPAGNGGWDSESQNKQAEDHQPANSASTERNPPSAHRNNATSMTSRAVAALESNFSSLFKSYWNDWTLKPDEAAKKREQSTENPSAGGFKILSHQVKHGNEELYFKPIYRPKYIDSFKKPYAVFLFKYRSPENIKRELSDPRSTLNIAAYPQVPSEKSTKDRPASSHRDKFLQMSKEQLFEQLRRAKGKAGYSTDSELESSSEDEQDGAGAKNGDSGTNKREKAPSQDKSAQDKESTSAKRGRNGSLSKQNKTSSS